MKKLFSLLVVLVSLSVWSQDREAKPSLPNFTPPSPEAFAITRYGDAPVNENTGKVNLSIPLLEYKAGQLKLPISLNYSGSGVKVDEVSNSTGIGWLLNAGGVINRTVYDLPDELVTGDGLYRIVLTDQEILANNTPDGTAGAAFFNKILRPDQSQYDTEVDLFNFNCNGFAGSFYFDKNFVPVFTKNDKHIKIEVPGNSTNNGINLRDNKTFVMITPDGVKYYFGGATATEYNIPSRYPGQTHVDGNFAPNSFYLYKIVHPVNGEITINYNTKAIYQDILGRSASVSVVDFSALPYECQTAYYGSSEQISYSNKVIKIQDFRYIKNISCANNGMVVSFEYLDNPNFNKPYLKGIRVINNANNIASVLKDIILNYSGLDSPASVNHKGRFFLTEVQLNNQPSLANKIEKYKFEYDDPLGLPERMSFAQDFCGYYNGETTNRSMFPDYINKLHPNLFTSVDYAKRNPNFSFAKKGTLKRVYYPTGGYTEFEYESNEVYDEDYKEYRLGVSTGFDEVTYSSIPGYNQFSETYIDYPLILKDQDITIHIQTNHSDPQGAPIRGKYVRLKITNVTDNIIVSNNAWLVSNGTRDVSVSFKKNKQYKIELSVDTPYETSTVQYNAQLQFTLYNGLKLIDGPGIRLKRKSNYTVANQPEEVKRYYYTAPDKINKPLEERALFDLKKMSYPMYIYNSFKYVRSCLGGFGFYPTSVTHFVSDPVYNYYDHSYSGMANYAMVTISHGGDNFEKGGTFKYFKNTGIDADGSHQISNGPTPSPFAGFTYPNTSIAGSRYSSKKNNYDLLNGELLAQYDFIKKNGNFYKLTQVNNTYNQEIVATQPNICGEYVYDIPYYENVYTGVTKVTYVVLNDFSWEELQEFPYPAYIQQILASPLLISNITYDANNNILQSYVYPNFDISLIPSKFLKVYATVYSAPSGIRYDNTSSNFYIKKYSINTYNNNLIGSTKKQYFDSILMPSFSLDDDYNVFITEPNEAGIKKLITNETYEYGVLKGLPTKITTTVSNGNSKEIRNTYVDQANSLTGLTTVQSTAYNILLNQNNVATPIQVKEYKNSGLLSTQRTLYKQNGTQVVAETIQASKENLPLEDRVVYEQYDTKGNPIVVSLKDGMKVKYVYNNLNQPIAKIENYTNQDNNAIVTSITDPCAFASQYTGALVTVFIYDSTTNLLLETRDNNCKKTTYVYDALQHLKQIIDNEGNVIKEFDTNYKQ